jgi:hypothetical protein
MLSIHFSFTRPKSIKLKRVTATNDFWASSKANSKKNLFRTMVFVSIKKIPTQSLGTSIILSSINSPKCMKAYSVICVDLPDTVFFKNSGILSIFIDAMVLVKSLYTSINCPSFLSILKSLQRPLSIYFFVIISSYSILVPFQHTIAYFFPILFSKPFKALCI